MTASAVSNIFSFYFITLLTGTEHNNNISENISELARKANE